jgi:hypothetical protein
VAWCWYSYHTYWDVYVGIKIIKREKFTEQCSSQVIDGSSQVICWRHLALTFKSGRRSVEMEVASRSRAKSAETETKTRPPSPFLFWRKML